MTRNTEFTDWPGKYGPPPVAPFTHCSPNLDSICDGLIAELGGGFFNGCFGVRQNRAGTAISTHGYAALDWSYRGLGRAGGLAAIDLVVENSLELGVQAVHDYIGCRIWRAGRNPAIYPDGWKIQPASATDGMGQAWADWLHFEVTDTAWFDDRPMMERVGDGAPPRVRPVVTLGSRGDLVIALQQFLHEKANQGAWVGRVDGQYGPRTRIGWLNFAIWMNTAYPGCMTTDGNVEGIDWNVVAWTDGGWERLLAAGFPPGI